MSRFRTTRAQLSILSWTLIMKILNSVYNEFATTMVYNGCTVCDEIEFSLYFSLYNWYPLD